jgi:hypothetical protein
MSAFAFLLPRFSPPNTLQRAIQEQAEEIGRLSEDFGIELKEESRETIRRHRDMGRTDRRS